MMGVKTRIVNSPLVKHRWGGSSGRQWRLRYRIGILVGGLFIGSLIVQLSINQIKFGFDTTEEGGLMWIWMEEDAPLEQEETLLDIINFTWISKNEGICKTVPGTGSVSTYPKRILPILVHSARDHVVERWAIRKTWGSLGRYRDWKIKVLFLLGQAEPGTATDKLDIDKALQAEQAQFGDLVIGSFTDTYRNLSYKTMMGFKWILEFCPEAELMLKVDDDMFLDITRWIDWLSDNDLDKNYTVPDVICNLYRKPIPYRKKGSSKYVVTEEEWPMSYYPDYCSGWAYAIRTDLLRKIYEVSSSVKMLWLEDVFTTGILLEEAKKRFDSKPEIRSMKEEFSYAGDFKENRRMCENGRTDYVRKFGAVAQVLRGKYFERDMKCWWDKVLYDQPS